MSGACPDEKIRHMASKMNQRGGVSALCFSRLHKINLKRETWTIVEGQVTCTKCLRWIAEAKAEAAAAKEENP